MTQAYGVSDRLGFPASFVFCGVKLWSTGFEQNGKGEYSNWRDFTIWVTPEEIRECDESP